jgi:hypothetical protein
MLRAWGRNEMHTEFWLENLKRIGYLGDLGVNGRILLKCILQD